MNLRRMLDFMSKDNRNVGLSLWVSPYKEYAAIASAHRALDIPIEPEEADGIKAVCKGNLSGNFLAGLKAHERPDYTWVSPKQFLSELKDFRARYQKETGIRPGRVLFCGGRGVWINAKYLKQFIEAGFTDGSFLVKSGKRNMPVLVKGDYGDCYICPVNCPANGEAGDFIVR